MLWILWLVIAVVALVGELASLALYLGSFGLAALCTMGIAFVAPLWAQLAAFVVLSVVFLVAVRPAALRFLPVPSGEGTAPRIGPVGSHGTVVQRIDARGGQIRIGQGEFWSARPLEPGETIDPQREVKVERMEGLVALVSPVAPRPIAPVIAAATTPDAGPAPFGLSAREVEVLQLVAEGLSNQEIADRLFLSPRTVHHHVSHILTKMNVDSRVDAVRIALQQGIVAVRE
jgi:DNA-binding CsgD family transcriptional regulator/membrane protein implicated in regulation of membrane protease activity